MIEPESQAAHCPYPALRDGGDGDGVPDGCDACPGYPDDIDCNHNGVPDACDINSGTSLDLNGDGIPDECGTCLADVAPAGGDGVVNTADLLAIINNWGSSNPQFDVQPPGGDGIVNTAELLLVINTWGECPP